MRLIKSLVTFVLIFPQIVMAEENLPFATATINLEKSPQTRAFDGVVEAVNKATVSAQVSGRVTTIKFDVNDFVKKGDVIIRIRDNEYNARLRTAKAGLNEAKAGYRDAELEFDRIKGLVKDRMVSDAEFDKAKAGLKAAEARVAASEAKITEAQEQVDNTVIRAPFSGVVVERHIEVGETTQVGQPVMTGFSLDELRVNTDIPQAFINAIRKHKKASVRFAENSSDSIPVKNMVTFPYANPISHTFRVRTNLPKKTKNLLPGMLVKVDFVINEAQRLLIPNNAIVRRSEVVAAYVLNEENQIILRQIRLGHRFGDKTEVLAGLSEGETVALDPVRAGIYLKQQAESK